MPMWSEEDFQRRAEARITQLKGNETGLLRGAGLSGDEIRKAPKRGRRIDTIAAFGRKWDRAANGACFGESILNEKGRPI